MILIFYFLLNQEEKLDSESIALKSKYLNCASKLGNENAMPASCRNVEETYSCLLSFAHHQILAKTPSRHHRRSNSKHPI